MWNYSDVRKYFQNKRVDVRSLREVRQISFHVHW